MKVLKKNHADVKWDYRLEISGVQICFDGYVYMGATETDILLWVHDEHTDDMRSHIGFVPAEIADKFVKAAAAVGCWVSA